MCVFYFQFPFDEDFEEPDYTHYDIPDSPAPQKSSNSEKVETEKVELGKVLNVSAEPSSNSSGGDSFSSGSVKKFSFKKNLSVVPSSSMKTPTTVTKPISASVSNKAKDTPVSIPKVPVVKSLLTSQPNEDVELSTASLASHHKLPTPKKRCADEILKDCLGSNYRESSKVQYNIDSSMPDKATSQKFKTPLRSPKKPKKEKSSPNKSVTDSPASTSPSSHLDIDNVNKHLVFRVSFCF